MSLAIVHSRAEVGVSSPLVTVETQLSGGLPGFSIVGLPETEVRESRDRVRAALLNCGFDFPVRRITVNLAPADLPKEGGRFDLPIAIGILAASGQLPLDVVAGYEFLGELALSGMLRPVRGALPAALKALDAGRAPIVPLGNAAEVGLLDDRRALAAESVLGVAQALRGAGELIVCAEARLPPVEQPYPDLAEVRGQALARRALEVAAAGGHHLLMIGPPGSGKTLLASRLPGVLPPLEATEALEVAAIQSVSRGGIDPAGWKLRPFRAPHHTASGVALVGGGAHPRPGEISLAHHGVLFLDELPEWSRAVLDVLREPLESGRILISRAARQCEFPARFQLVAAMNPCPCGYYGDPSGRCRCSPDLIGRYQSRVSGPLMDRIDLRIEVPRPSHRELSGPPSGDDSSRVRARVLAARERQQARAGVCNALLAGEALQRDCALAEAERRLLEQAAERGWLSARAYHRVLRVARTLADLDGLERIGRTQLLEALSYRRVDLGGARAA